MDTTGVIQLFILLILVLLSAFFSSAETALTSVSKVRIRTLAEDGNKAKFRQIVGRNILLYAIEFFMFYLSGLLAITYVSVVFVFNNTFQSMMIVSAMTLIPLSVMLFFILRCLKKYNVMPHSHFSHTKEVAYGRKKLEPEIANE